MAQTCAIVDCHFINSFSLPCFSVSPNILIHRVSKTRHPVVMVCRYLWVCWLCWCLLLFSGQHNATFRPRSTICLEIYSLTPSLYIPSTDTNFGLISHRPKSRLRPNQTIVTMGWRVFETQCTYSDSCIWLGPFFRDMNNHSFSRISKLNYIKYGQYTGR